MFLQTKGLGLARNQWDANFRAFDPYGYQLRRVADLPWMDYQAGDWTFSSAELPQELWSNWTPIPKTHPGYMAGLDCYYYGYRPPDVEYGPLLGVRERFGLGALPPPFKICQHRMPERECPGCPAPVPCPPAPTCPDCPACDCPKPVQTTAPVKYGVNIGLLVAAGLTAGVGYYGYRKGWFRRKSA